MRGATMWLALGVGCAGPEVTDAEVLPTVAAPPAAPFSLTAGNLVAGRTASLQFTGAPPSALVRFAYGTQGLAPGLCPPVLAGSCLGIGSSAQLMTLTALADASGAGTLNFALPAGAALRNVGLQAVVIGPNPALSNPVARVVGAVGTVVTPGDDRDLDGFTPAQGDCADFNGSIYPGAPDTPGDGYDANCDDVDGFDGDGDGSPAGLDCDDGDPSVYPGAVDTCDGTDEDCDGAIDGSSAGPSCGRVDSFAGGAPSADLLFVVDNSCSMTEEQGRLAAAGARLFGPLVAAAADVQVGVVTTDMDDPSQSGRLQEALGAKIADGVTVPYSTWWPAAVNQGTAGYFDEKGLEAAYTALTPPLIGSDNLGFLRAAADLHVVFVTDEPDFSAASPTTWSPWFGGMKSGAFRSVAHGLVGPAAGCSTADAGTEYLSVIGTSGGVVGSVCDIDYGPFFDDLSAEILAAAGGSVFTLLQPADPATIEVQVDLPGIGLVTLSPSDWVYDAGANTVEIVGVTVPAGSTVYVLYDL